MPEAIISKKTAVPVIQPQHQRAEQERGAEACGG